MKFPFLVVTLAVVLTTVLSIEPSRAIETRELECEGQADGSFVYNTCSTYFICNSGSAIAQTCVRGSYFYEPMKACVPDTDDQCPENAIECTGDGTFSDSPTNCSTFYVCFEGENIEQSCGRGSIFDDATLSCQPDPNCFPVECTEEGAFSPHATSCSLFYVCYDGGLVEQSCERGSYFDDQTLSCQPDTANTCFPVECTVDGEFSPHATNCSLFYVCYEGELVEQNCGAGSYFDDQTLSCQPDTDNTCSPVDCTQNGVFSPHATNCSLFYVCYDGKLIEQSCGNGSYFDTDNLYCIPDKDNVCWVIEPTTPAPCQCPGGYAEGDFVANPDSCSLFFICSGGQLLEQNCGVGNYFNADTKACEKDEKNECWPLDTTTTTEPASCSCPGGYAEGDFVANPDSCSLYSICSDGQLLEQNCGVGNYFNADTKACEKDEKNECWPLDTTTTTEPASCSCPGGYAEGDFVANPDSCSLYSICSGGQLLEQNCGTGNYFNADTKACEKDEKNECWPLDTTTTTEPASCSCPGGYAEGDFVANPDSCSLYSICSGGQLLEQNCGTGNYFNADTKTCEKDDNNVCWPLETTTTSSCSCPGGYAEGDFVANPDSCSLYSICSGGQLLEQNCGTGNYFNANTKTCDRDENNECWPQETTTTVEPASCSCPGGYKDGDLVENDDSCSSYFVCVEGNLIVQSCGSGNYFDRINKACVQDDSGICWSNPTTTASPAASQCPGGYQDGDLIEHADSCSAYSVCVEKKLIAQSCGSGNYFDRAKKACVRDISGKCWSNPTAASPVTRQCPGGYKNGDLVENDDSCSSYFVCVEGRLTAQSCGSGNYFDRINKGCVRDVTGTCWSSLTTVASAATSQCLGGYKDGDFIENEGSCSSYFVCVERKLIAQTCGSGNYFDRVKKVCVRDVTGICWSKVTTPATTYTCQGGYKEGDHVENSESCSSYFVCSEGNLLEQSCGKGRYFDALSRICALDERGECWKPTIFEIPPTTTDSTTTEAPVVSTPALEKRFPCPNGYADGDVFPYPSNCSKFYVCLDKELIETTCDYGNYFNDSLKSCVLDTLGLCWKVSSPLITTEQDSSGQIVSPAISCPGGYVAGDLAPYPSNCSKFYICFNGELIEDSCGFGNYFDKSSSNCVLDTLETCWQKLSPSTETSASLTTQSTTEGPTEQAASFNIVASDSCPEGYDDGDFAPSPKNCFMFYFCYGGKFIEKSCGYGNYFDNSSKTCILDTTGICWHMSRSPTDVKDSLTDDSITTTHLSSTKHSKSHRNSKKSSSTKKPYAPSTSTISTDYACPEGYVDGDFAPNPSNCSMFYICYNRKLFEESCGYGNYFHNSTKSCLLDTLGECWQIATTPKTHQQHIKTSTSPSSEMATAETSTTTKPSSTNSNKTTCPGGYKERDFAPHPRNCSLFYICYRGKLIKESCGYGNYFDNSSMSCILDTDGVCWKVATSSIPTTTSSSKPTSSIPPTSTPIELEITTSTDLPRTCAGGFEYGDFVQYPNNCSMFFICYNGKLMEDSCGYGNYFDNSSKSCVLDVLGVCWQTSESSATTATTRPSSTIAQSTTTKLTSTSTSTTKQPFSCLGRYKDGEHFAYPDDCSMFYTCYKGKLIEDSCGYRNYFDDSAKACIFDTTGVCWQTPTSTPSTIAPSTTTGLTVRPPKQTYGCAGGYADGEFIPHPSSCYQFLVCYHGEVMEVTCGFGNYFDEASRSCVLDKRGICWSKTAGSSTTLSTIQVTTEDPRSCAGGYADGEFVAVPGNCFLFFVCYRGKLSQLSCGKGNYFDKDRKSCVFDTLGECWTKEDTDLPAPTSETRKHCANGMQEGELTPHPTSCYQYFICNNEHLVNRSCGTFNYFNPLTNKCERDSAGNCWPAQPATTAESKLVKCPRGLKDGEFIASPSSCFLYQICSNGALVEGDCGTFNYFNPLTNKCERDSKGICWPAQPITSAETKQIECANGVKEGQFVAHPSSCYFYQVCSNGELVERSCGIFNYFDPIRGLCDRDANGVCWPIKPTALTATVQRQCPNGLNEGQYTDSSLSCFHYEICSNGELVEGNCGTFNYFNPTTKVCELDESGVCWPAKPTIPTETRQIECSNGLKDGESTANPSSCYLYQTCSNGQLVDGNCGESNFFNNCTNMCEPDTDGNCWPKQTPPPTEAPTTPATEAPTTPATEATTTPTTEAPTTPAPIPTPCGCSNGLVEGQFAPHSSSCSHYYICSGGQLVEGDCGYGNYFNTNENICARDNAGICWPLRPTPPTPSAPPPPPPPPARPTPPSSPASCPIGTVNGQFLAIPSSCHLYYICNNGQLVESDCGAGNIFNRTTEICEPDILGICWPLKSKPCPSGMVNGQFMANPSSPQLYYICNNGQLVGSDCGSGNSFSTVTQICQPNTLGVSSPSTSKACPTGMVNGQMMANPSSLQLYYICNNGQLVESDCGSGNIFNRKTQICQPNIYGISSPSASTSCPTGVLNGQFVAIPSSPQQYYICNNGQLVLSDCGSGNIFNRFTQICEPNILGIGRPSASKTCPIGMTNGQFMADPSSSQKYYICNNGQLVASDCGTGNVFNRTTQICEPNPLGNSNPCPIGMLNGDFLAIPSSCQKYYTCTSGQLVESDCGSGNFFNRTNQTCAPDILGICSPSTFKACPIGMLSGQFMAIPSSCQQYYICNSGRLLESDCGSGNIFNRTTQICAPDTLGICSSSASKACPTGMVNGQFSANPSSLQKYYICNNGQLVEGDCGSGNIFNSVTLICQPSTLGSSSTTTSKACPIGMVNGQLMANPSSSQKYYICSSGQLVESDCGTGNVFNKLTQICEPNLLGTSTLTKTCPIGMLTGQLMANPSSTQRFYICNYGQLVEGDCGTGNVFNKLTQICEPSFLGINKLLSSSTCPTGMLSGQLMANPSSTQLFYICNNGQLVTGDCGSGNIFNTLTQICQPSTISSSSTSTSCPTGVLNGQFVAIPSSPQQYYICNNGQLVLSDCGSGNIFNKFTQICEPNIYGINSPSNACPTGMVNGQFMANPSSSQKYYICNNGQLVASDCGSGNIFNSTTQICEPNPLGNSNPCPIGMLNGQFLAIPSSCRQYYVCTNGQLVERNCKPGNFFNRTSQICAPDILGICSPSTFLACPVGMQSGQSMAIPSSCQQYYTCNNGRLLENDCGVGNIFNRTTQVCESDVKGICCPGNQCPCPGGIGSGQFVPIAGECDKFSICNNGTLIEQSCGVGYLFDTVNKYCVRDINGSCWTVPTSTTTCANATDGTFLPNEAACNKFFMCYNNTKISQECGVGNIFNTATLSCVRDTLGSCWKRVSNVCASAAVGSFVPNPNNCQEFYVCHANRAVLQQCGNGNWFNPAVSICQPDVNAVCINVCQGIAGDVQLPHSNCNQFYTCSNGLTVGVGTCPTGTNFDALSHVCLSTAVCEANLCSSSANGVVYPVEGDASSFYSCYNHIALKLSCPEGTAFDETLSICAPETGRCVGRRNGFTIASPNNPNAYYVCKNNLAIFEQCPSYAVFDEKKGICMQAQRKRVASNICTTEPDGSVLPGDSCNRYNLCLDGEVIEQNCGAYSAFSVKLGYCVFNLSCFDRNEICAKSTNLEKFPDARRETSFVKCKNGVALFEKCPKHLIYNHDIGYCAPREMGMSDDELEELCEDNLDNVMASALDCRKFYICRKKTATLQQCAVDQYFDVETASCRPDVSRQCWLKSETLRRSFFLKSVCLEDESRGHPDDSTLFETCSYGMWIEKSCPRGQIFDSQAKSCIPGDAKDIHPRARSDAVLDCLNEMSLRPSSEACSDYYRCEGNHWNLKRCPLGEFFNPLTAACSTDTSACARLQETQSTKSNHCVSNETRASYTNCGLFHICYEGEWWFRHCAEGTYFNKSQDACIPNDETCRLTAEKDSCKNGTVKPTDFNPCSAYHLCVDGYWTVQYCPAGHHFNESHKACMMDDEEGLCRAGVRIQTSPCVDGERRFQTSNCAAFDICSFGKWLSVPCPQGFYFDTSLRRCITNRGDCSTDGVLRRDCIEGTSRPSQHNCTEFYFCSKGKWYVESCLKGFQYNATSDKCIQTNATCPGRAPVNWTQSKCPDLETVTSVPHESNCTKYNLCVHGLTVEADCASGQFYDEKEKRCRLNNGSCVQPSPPSDGICKEKSNGSQMQNPANCTSFYTCTDAIAVLSFCPVGQYFNAVAGACQPDTGVCNKIQLCNNSTADNVPHETFCNIYYSCVRGLAIPVACEDGQLFDPFTRMCTPDVRKRCVDGILVGDAICLSGDENQPKADTDDCSRYIICSNGTAQRLQCPQGEFFNTSTLTCLPNDGSCLNASNSSEAMTCTGKHGYLMPDLEHCNEFYVCIYGALQHDRCIDGEYFDITTRRCIPGKSNQTCSTAAELPALCANAADGSNFADQSDCRKYFQCNDAELQSKKCRTGESFDTLLGFCRQNDGTCLLENGQRVGACAGKHGKVAMDRENCRGYFTCINGQKISEECENDEFFDNTTKTCRKDLNNTCTPIENELVNKTQLTCNGLIELVFYPNVIDGCRTFYQCVKGTPRIHKCPDDLLFNGVSGICDWKDYVKCIDMTEHHNSDEQLCVNATNGTRYGTAEDNCDSYFICTNGKLNRFKCDNGLKFNMNLDKCDLAANVNCTMTSQI